MSNGITGGCACGATRYRLAAAPFDAGWCHCRICQLTSGAPAVAFASVAPDDFAFTAGETGLRRFDSSATGHRLFCGACGTPLLMRANDGGGTIDFSLATLDDPAPFPPGFRIFFVSRLPWDEPADALPRFPGPRREG